MTDFNKFLIDTFIPPAKELTPAQKRAAERLEKKREENAELPPSFTVSRQMRRRGQMKRRKKLLEPSGADHARRVQKALKRDRKVAKQRVSFDAAKKVEELDG